MFNILKPFIFKFNPETAHSMAIKALKYGYIPPVKIKDSFCCEAPQSNNTIKIYLFFSIIFSSAIR